MYAIIVSKQDPAGLNIHKQLLENFPFKVSDKKFDDNIIFTLQKDNINFQLILINKPQIYADYIGSIDTELFIFASKHKGEKPALTVHPIGNPCQAKFGGKDFEFVQTSPLIMKNYLCHLNSQLNSLSHNYTATYEATHHGPFLSKPAIFIEQGGSEKEWNDSEASKLIAETIINYSKPSGKKIAIGIGDMHYPYYFNKLALKTDIAFSHIIPKHNLQFLTKELLQKLIFATPKLDLFILDWKNLGPTKEKLLPLIEETKIPYEKAHKIKAENYP